MVFFWKGGGKETIRHVVELTVTWRRTLAWISREGECTFYFQFLIWQVNMVFVNDCDVTCGRLPCFMCSQLEAKIECLCSLGNGE